MELAFENEVCFQGNTPVTRSTSQAVLQTHFCAPLKCDLMCGVNVSTWAMGWFLFFPFFGNSEMNAEGITPRTAFWELFLCASRKYFTCVNRRDWCCVSWNWDQRSELFIYIRPAAAIPETCECHWEASKSNHAPRVHTLALCMEKYSVDKQRANG